MTRCYYAVLDDTVYIFERRKLRERFCVEKKAKRIFSYERNKYKVHVDMTKTAKKRSNSHGTVRNDNSSIKTQSAVNRLVNDRQRMFKGQR